MKFISLFDAITGVPAKDVFANPKTDGLIFLVPQGKVGQAVGRNGQNVQKLERIIKKRIRIVEFDEDPIRFISNFVYPLKVDSAQLDGKTITLRCPDTKTKALLIGRESGNLTFLVSIVSRYFDVESIKIG